MSAAVSDERWRKVFHATLYRFSRDARAQILHDLRAARNRPSENYAYDTVHHQYEITCLSADGEDVENDLTRIIADFLQEEDNKSSEYADYVRKAVRFPYAFLDEESPLVDDAASEPNEALEDDDLINLNEDPKESFWSPSTSALQLERFDSAGLLDAVAFGTHSRLSVDIPNRRVLIVGLQGNHDAETVKRRLSNLEAITISKPPIMHTLKAQKPQDLELHFHKLHEKAESKKGFNEDRTLTKLLVHGDSPLFHGCRDETRGRALQQLYVLRPYKVESFPGSSSAQPIKTRIQPLKDALSKPLTSRLSRMRFRDVGIEASSSVKTELLPQPGVTEVESWMEGITRAEPLPSRPQLAQASSFSTNRKGEQKKKQDANTAVTSTAKSTTRPPALPVPQSKGAVASTTLGATRGPTNPGSSNNMKPSANSAFSSSPWRDLSAPVEEPTTRPLKSPWGPTPRAAYTQPQTRNRPQQACGALPVSNSAQKSNVHNRNPNSEAPRVVPASKPVQQKPPSKPASMSVASANPFAGLVDQGEGEDDSDEQQDASDDISERLAADDDPPPRLRANRQKASGPPPSPKVPLQANNSAVSASLGTHSIGDNCPQGNSCPYRHDRTALAIASLNDSSAESASCTNATPDATSVESTSSSSFTDMLKEMKQNERELALGSSHFRNALAGFHSALERARALRGSLSISAQLGKVIVNNAPSEARKDITNKNFESKLKQFSGFDTMDQTFLAALTTSSGDVDSLLESLGVNERVSSIHESAYFEFTCIRSDKTTTRIVVDVLGSDDHRPATPFARSSETILGAWYDHHPQRFWDSRITLTNHTNYPLANHDGAEAFVDHLSIRHKPGMPGPNVSGRNDEALHMQAAHFYSTTRWPLVRGWTVQEDVYIEVKRVLDMPVYLKKDDPNATMGLFLAPCLSEEEMARDQRLWFEISLGLTNPSPAIAQNEPHPQITDPGRPIQNQAAIDALRGSPLALYEKSDWKPEDVLKPDQLLALHEAATGVVHKMDGVGARNKGFGAEREAKLIRERKKLESTPDQFW